MRRIPYGIEGFSALLGLVIWEAVARWSGLPPFILPGPEAVVRRFVQVVETGLLWKHIQATAVEVLLGLALGMTVALPLGYIMARWPLLERLVTPYTVASQALPVVAIAPLLIIWFGPGLFSKVLICALIVFFPVLVNTVVGLRTIPQAWRDLLRVLHASWWQTLWYLEWPAALPVIAGGLRIGATLAVIGAVVGEFIAADRGLGFLINAARGRYDTALVFVALAALMAMALVLYAAVRLLERRLLTWQSRQTSQVHRAVYTVNDRAPTCPPRTTPRLSPPSEPAAHAVSPSKFP